MGKGVLTNVFQGEGEWGKECGQMCFRRKETGGAAVMPPLRASPHGGDGRGAAVFLVLLSVNGLSGLSVFMANFAAGNKLTGF